MGGEEAAGAEHGDAGTAQFDEVGHDGPGRAARAGPDVGEGRDQGAGRDFHGEAPEQERGGHEGSRESVAGGRHDQGAEGEPSEEGDQRHQAAPRDVEEEAQGVAQRARHARAPGAQGRTEHGEEEPDAGGAEGEGAGVHSAMGLVAPRAQPARRARRARRAARDPEGRSEGDAQADDVEDVGAQQHLGPQAAVEERVGQREQVAPAEHHEAPAHQGRADARRVLVASARRAEAQDQGGPGEDQEGRQGEGPQEACEPVGAGAARRG